jgi:hypothetical protein
MAQMVLTVDRHLSVRSSLAIAATQAQAALGQPQAVVLVARQPQTLAWFTVSQHFTLAETERRL